MVIYKETTVPPVIEELENDFTVTLFVPELVTQLAVWEIGLWLYDPVTEQVL